MQLEIYNTLGREVQEFKPIDVGRVGMYACGPTVYNYAHIGNLRTYVFEDVLRRVLEYAGYHVEHVMNITDVGHLTDNADEGEDKMLKSAREKKMSVWDIAEYYTRAFFDAVDRLNIKRPTVICKATDHISEMIAFIRRLEERGFTYTSGGNVYFDISRFPDYGKMALLDTGELQAGARIQVDPNKQNPHDFVLWFTRSKYEHQAMLWDSPWGRGYPGWHIECSTMSMKYLGERFDIHCGGVDHISVHHTNEISQSEAATGKKWVNYWVHGEHLLMGRGKMAKSEGGFLTLPSLMERGFDPMDYRYYLLGAHYRVQLQFGFEALKAAKSARKRLLERVVQLKAEAGDEKGFGIEPGTEEEISLRKGGAGKYIESFEGNALNDMNMPRCLSDLWGVIREGDLGAETKLKALAMMDRVLGLRLLESRIQPPELGDEEKALIAERERARGEKNYALADKIRNQLLGRGISLEDTPDGVRWSRERIEPGKEDLKKKQA